MLEIESVGSAPCMAGNWRPQPAIRTDQSGRPGLGMSNTRRHVEILASSFIPPIGTGGMIKGALCGFLTLIRHSHPHRGRLLSIEALTCFIVNNPANEPIQFLTVWSTRARSRLVMEVAGNEINTLSTGHLIHDL
jgi:hypothetical protein